MRQKVQVGAAVIAAAAGIAVAPAAGKPGSDPRSELDVTFGAQTPGTPTGAKLRVVYKNPKDPKAKPPPITAALFELPAGTRIDGRAAPACEASDADFRALGRNACPSASRIGTGSLTAITGFGPPADPVRGDVTVFNGGDEIIELVTAKGGEAVLGMDRLGIEGSALRAHPPSTPGGPPDGRSAISEVSLTLPARGRLLVTPPSCPRSGTWTSRGMFGFADGGRSTVSSTTPCTRAARTRLAVSPRRAALRRRVRFRVRASSTRPGCATGAIVRVGSRSLRTNSRGRATARLRFGAAGRRAVTLRKRGCPTARARVRVRVLRRG